MAVAFTRLYDRPFPLYHYCITGVSNAEDKPQFVTPQFSPNLSSTHDKFTRISNRLSDVCSTTVELSAQFCGIVHPQCAIITHLHQLPVNFKGRKTASCTEMKSDYKLLCEMKFLPLLPPHINLSHEQILTDRLLSHLLHVALRTSATSYWKIKYAINMKGTRQQNPTNYDSHILCVTYGTYLQELMLR